MRESPGMEHHEVTFPPTEGDLSGSGTVLAQPCTHLLRDVSDN